MIIRGGGRLEVRVTTARPTEAGAPSHQGDPTALEWAGRPEVELGVRDKALTGPVLPQAPWGPGSLPGPRGHSPLNMMASPWPSFCFSRKSL